MWWGIAVNVVLVIFIIRYLLSCSLKYINDILAKIKHIFTFYIRAFEGNLFNGSKLNIFYAFVFCLSWQAKKSFVYARNCPVATYCIKLTKSNLKYLGIKTKTADVSHINLLDELVEQTFLSEFGSSLTFS